MVLEGEDAGGSPGTFPKPTVGPAGPGDPPDPGGFPKPTVGPAGPGDPLAPGIGATPGAPVFDPLDRYGRMFGSILTIPNPGS